MRGLVVVLAVGLTAAIAVPAPAVPGRSTAATPSIEELEQLRDQLADARGDLEGLDAAVAAATDELDAIEERLAGASAELATLTADLEDARAARDAAVAHAAEATAALLEATASLEETAAAVEDHEGALADRVRNMWKHGAADPGSMLLEGLARSQSFHDASVTMQTVEDLLDENRRLVDDATTATRTQARARTGVAEAQQAARAAEATASAEHARVEALVAQQEQVVATVEAERVRRQEVLDLLASDREATARLVQRLDEQVAQLAGRLASALLESNPDANFDGPPPPWAAALPGRGREFAPAIVGAAELVGVDPRLLAALVWSESAFHPGAISHAGARGLAQLMPGTAAGLGVDPDDPIANLVGGATYLRMQLERFGRVDLALAAYNAGPGRVVAAGNRIPNITETQVYVLRVLERHDQLVNASG